MLIVSVFWFHRTVKLRPEWQVYLISAINKSFKLIV
jgi:hypothetical protein